MIWVLLAAAGVPLWLCALAIVTLAVRNRNLRRRPGNIAVRVHKPHKAPGKGWRRGHGVWVHDVFAFRGSPAAWSEVLAGATAAKARAPSADEARKLRRLTSPVVVSLRLDDDQTLDVAAAGEDEPQLLGPFAKSPPPTPPTA